MSILDRLVGRMGYAKDEQYAVPLLTADDISQKAQPQQSAPGFLMQTANNERWNMPDYGLADAQLTTYQAYYAIADAVSFGSRYSATAKMEVQRLVNEKREAVINHPFELLLNKPNPVQSRFRLFEATFADMQLAGNAYWWLNKLNPESEPLEIFQLPANRIKAIPGGQIGLVSHYEWNAGLGKSIPLAPWEIVHFKEYHPRNMFTGLSRIESVAPEIEKDMKAIQYDLNFYGKDNAKPEGILGVTGQVEDDIWNAMQDHFKGSHGGVKREMAMVQGLEDIKYVQLALNHADMEFIAGRTFSRDEIYNHFMPGLPSILSVNSTEANARTGKATVMEFGVWPLLVSVHETITNCIMPLYGENLVALFEDVRLSDKAMELSEVTEYAKTHTIDETREKYYQSPPVGDERGELFVIELGKTSHSTTATTTETTTTTIDGDAPDDRNAETGGETGDDDETAGQKAVMKAELKQWKRFAAKRIGRDGAEKSATDFKAQHIELSLVGAIEGALEGISTKAESNAIFDTVLEWEGYP